MLRLPAMSREGDADDKDIGRVDSRGAGVPGAPSALTRAETDVEAILEFPGFCGRRPLSLTGVLEPGNDRHVEPVDDRRNGAKA